MKNCTWRMKTNFLFPFFVYICSLIVRISIVLLNEHLKAMWEIFPNLPLKHMDSEELVW